MKLTEKLNNMISEATVGGLSKDAVKKYKNLLDGLDGSMSDLNKKHDNKLNVPKLLNLLANEYIHLLLEGRTDGEPIEYRDTGLSYEILKKDKWLVPKTDETDGYFDYSRGKRPTLDIPLKKLSTTVVPDAKIKTYIKKHSFDMFYASNIWNDLERQYAKEGLVPENEKGLAEFVVYSMLNTMLSDGHTEWANSTLEGLLEYDDDDDIKKIKIFNK